MKYVIIPAYKPGPLLSGIVDSMRANGFLVTVVDDGSGPEYDKLFDVNRMLVVRHERNRGKGAALKSGLKVRSSDGVLTMDADGQHGLLDAIRVWGRFSKDTSVLVLGSRDFRGAPFVRRIANAVARFLVRTLAGIDLRDTQTGLRAIPRVLMERCLELPENGFEFETRMLIEAKRMGIRIVEEPIRTIYNSGSGLSHFRVFRDSLKICKVLLTQA